MLAETYSWDSICVAVMQALFKICTIMCAHMRFDF